MNQIVPHRQEWLHASPADKVSWCRSLEGAGGHAFRFQGLETWRFGSSEEDHGIFTLDGCAFVFVPADDVVLGWGELDPQDEQFVAALGDELEIAGEPRSVHEFLRGTLSPLRPARIPPLLVECDGRLAGEREGQLIVLEPHADDQWRYAVHYETVVADFARHGFALPTEDEWEYLCGARTKRIFGEHVDEDLVRDICSGKQQHATVDTLKRLTHLGVYIAYDDYTFELVQAPCLVKGADGGGACCGGYPAAALLTLSPHFRREFIEEVIGSDRLFEYPVFVRRIVRLVPATG